MRRRRAAEVGPAERVDSFGPSAVGGLRLRSPDGCGGRARGGERVEERDERGRGAGGLFHVGEQREDASGDKETGGDDLHRVIYRRIVAHGTL